MAKIIRGKRTTGLLVGFGVVALVIIATLPSLPTSKLFQTIENKTYDFRYANKVRTLQEPTIEDVVIVDIDDASLAQLGRFQDWPRFYHAKLTDYISRGGAAAIAFDLLLPESDSLQPVTIELFKSAKQDTVAAKLKALKFKIRPDSVSQVIDAVLGSWGYDADFGDICQAYGNVYFPFHMMTGTTVDTFNSDRPIRGMAFRFDSTIRGNRYAYVVYP